MSQGSCLNCDADGYCACASATPKPEGLGIDEDGFCVNEVNCEQYEDEMLFYDPSVGFDD